jgi:hypothetical protein
LYTGKIQFDYATVIPLVSLADKYNVKDLLRIGISWMTRNVSTACKRNQVVSWYQFTSASGHGEVANLCKDFIKWNFEMVSNNIDFQNMDLKVLLSFVQCNDLVVTDEMSLFACVDKWLLAQKEIMLNSGEDPVHLDRYVHTLLPHIRFPMMTPAQLADLILNPLAETHMELLVEKIRMAMAYHKNQKFDYSLDSRLFTPRLYTTEKFCAALTVNHYFNLQSYTVRSLLFSTASSIAANVSHSETGGQPNEETYDWTVDCFPKGVWIQKCLTVYKPSGVEVPGRVLRTVRVAISTRAEAEQMKRVKIGLLLYGTQDDFEHVREVVTRNYFFSENDQVLNFDEVLDYFDLMDMRDKSKFLTGPTKEELKIKVVITPLTKFSCLELS